MRFDEEEFAAIVAEANRADLSPAAYVGTAAVAAAVSTEPPGSPVREALSELMQARTARRCGSGWRSTSSRRMPSPGVR